MRRFFSVLLVVLVLGAAAAAGAYYLRPELVTSLLHKGTPAVPSDAGALTGEQTVVTANAVGRTGTFYVPRKAPDAGALPLLVILHGTGGDGAAAIRPFKALADDIGFVVLGPDSGKAPNGQYAWEVGDSPGDVTADRRHVVACVEEVMQKAHVDPLRVLVAGHSAGASSAPYLATNDAVFSSFAVLHGGVVEGGLGPLRPRGWFSSGSGDTIRPAAGVASAADVLKKKLGFTDIELRTFKGGHDVSREETKALVRWWLGIK
jgi:poly(3-hydroxybutyrate) depolymerase